MKKNEQQDKNNQHQINGLVGASGELLTNPLKMVKTAEPQPIIIKHMFAEYDDVHFDEKETDNNSNNRNKKK